MIRPSNALKPATAERVRQLAANRPSQPPPTVSGRGRLSAFVRCTSAIAAAGTGVGAQCYAGVIVDPDSTATSQPELGTVWLTLLSDGGLEAVPRVGGVYECLLAGVVDATGTADVRARAFSAAGDSAKPSPDCSRILGLIRRGNCFKLTIPEALGDGLCVDDSQTADLTWSTTNHYLTSATTITGCPPPSGATIAWTPILDMCSDSCGRPEERLRFLSGSGSTSRTITFSNVGCGTDANGVPYIDFYTDSPLFCSGSPAGVCGKNGVRVRLTCMSCNVLVCCPDGSIEFPRTICLEVDSSSWCDPSHFFVQMNYVDGADGWWSDPVVTCWNGDVTEDHSMVKSVRYKLLCSTVAPMPGKFVFGIVTYTDTEGLVEDAEFNNIGDFQYDCETGIWTTDTVTVSEFSFQQGTYTISNDDCSSHLPTYNCIDGSCIDPGDSSGTFAGETALQDCLMACSGGGGGGGGGGSDIPAEFCPDSVGDVSTLVIVGGADAGTYHGHWADNYSGAGSIGSTFVLPGGSLVEYSVSGNSEGNGIWSITRVTTGPQTFGSVLTHSCDPLALTFDPAVGPTGTTSVTLS
jgi:hypothetical protein